MQPRVKVLQSPHQLFWLVSDLVELYQTFLIFPFSRIPLRSLILFPDRNQFFFKFLLSGRATNDPEPLFIDFGVSRYKVLLRDVLSLIGLLS